MLFNVVVIVLTLLAFALEELIPAIPLAQNARLFIAPVFFFCASVAVPFPVMLLLAFMTGFLWDARYLQISEVDAAVEAMAGFGEATAVAGYNPAISSGMDLRFGVSILVFGVIGLLMQGIRPLFRKVRWELPVLMVGFVTALWLSLQYLLITFLRGDLFFVFPVLSKLITTTLMSMLLSPLIFLSLHTLARLTNYEIKYDGLRYTFDGR
jgi:cell shape-determining protein MreD